MTALLLAAVVGGSFYALAEDPAVPAAPELKTPEQKFSYVVGMKIGMNIKRIPANLDVEAIARGLKDAFSGGATVFSPEEASQIEQAFMMSLQEAQMKKGETSKKEGADFLAANGKKPGVTTTESGLQYQVLTEGSGAKPTLADKVKVHYHGTLIDGTVFDSSVQRGEPISLPLEGVIKGWQEGMQLMNTGAKYRLFIPSELGYGDSASGIIPPNSVLIFDVELLEIMK